MADTFKFYCERADAAAEAAKNTTLDNVRERELRAEKTWRGLAMKAQAVAVQREEVERERVERRNAEIERELQERDRSRDASPRTMGWRPQASMMSKRPD